MLGANYNQVEVAENDTTYSCLECSHLQSHTTTIHANEPTKFHHVFQQLLRESADEVTIDPPRGF